MEELLKLIKKNPATSVIFKRNSTVDEKAVYDFLMKNVFNNQEAKAFMKANDIYYTNKYSEHIDYSMIVKDIVKIYNRTQQGKISTETKKELSDWVNQNGGRRRLSSYAMRELSNTKGIRPNKPIVLYRGLLFSKNSIEEKEEALMFLRALQSKTHAFTMKWDRPSSWTDSKKIADKFAKYRAAVSQFDAMTSWFSRTDAIDGELGIIVATIARPEDVLIDLSTINISSNHGGEGEFILKKDTQVVHIIKAYTKKGEINLSDSSPIMNNYDDIITKLKEIPIPEDIGIKDYTQLCFKEINQTKILKPSIINNYNTLINRLKEIVGDTTTIDINKIDTTKVREHKQLNLLIEEFIKIKDISAVGYFNSIRTPKINNIMNDKRSLRSSIPECKLMSTNNMTQKTLQPIFSRIIKEYDREVPNSWHDTITEVEKILRVTYRTLRVNDITNHIYRILKNL